MPKEEGLIEKLEKWVKEHPENADIPHINITTQKEFTIRSILNELVQERDRKAAIVDKDVLEIKKQIEKWIGG